MKLPTRHTATLRPANLPRDAEPRARVAPATVAYSPNWNHYSWSSAGHVSQANEVALINEMIAHAAGPNGGLVQAYAQSAQCNVYVRTGLHTSVADPVDHVQVQLGLPNAPWADGTCPGYTCHIQYVAGANGAPPTYPTTCFAGLHGGG